MDILKTFNHIQYQYEPRFRYVCETEIISTCRYRLPTEITQHGTSLWYTKNIMTPQSNTGTLSRIESNACRERLSDNCDLYNKVTASRPQESPFGVNFRELKMVNTQKNLNPKRYLPHRNHFEGPAQTYINGIWFVQKWYWFGALHRPHTEGPAIVEHLVTCPFPSRNETRNCCSGIMTFYLHGKRHRPSDQGPAIIRPNGQYEYYNEGNIHRSIIEGPAIIHHDYNKCAIIKGGDCTCDPVGEYFENNTSVNKEYLDYFINSQGQHNRIINFCKSSI
ncbi:MAG: hypothetical protein JKX76_02425 [Colwellia sp.]|nr:hypothetical protein [Colwellia sp.]